MPDDPTARRCENCLAPPGRPCPHWIGPEAGIIEVDDFTKQQRLFVGCSCGAFMARITRYIIQTNARVAGATESMRDEVIRTIVAEAKAARLATKRADALDALNDLIESKVARRIKHDKGG